MDFVKSVHLAIECNVLSGEAELGGLALIDTKTRIVAAQGGIDNALLTLHLADENQAGHAKSQVKYGACDRFRSNPTIDREMRTIALEAYARTQR